MFNVPRNIFRRLRAYINRKLGPTSLPGDGIGYWRERIFHYFSLALIFLGVAIYLYFGIFFLLAGQHLFFAFTTFTFVSLLLVVSIPRFSRGLKVGWVLFVLYLTGAFLLFVGPHTNIGLLFLFSCSVMAVTMAGASAATFFLLVQAATLLGVGIYWYSGMFAHPDPPDISLETFINLGVSFLVLSMITLAPLMSLLNGLMFNVKKEQRYLRILRQEQEHLVKARLKAEESDTLKTAFLSNMSHEIRTPMNAILGFSNLLTQNAISDEDKKEFTDLIRVNANSLMSLVEDIIDISKMESGQFDIRNAPCYFHQILKEVYDIYNEELHRRGIFAVKLYLKKGLTDDGVQILTDGVRLKKILMNLVGNAIKFTDKGYVEFGYTMESEHHLRFYIKDTGIGLPEGAEEQIFSRFYKCPQNEEKLYGGIGIGLTIARHLVNHMGGEIWVEPRAAVGTTFCFTLPFQRAVVMANQKIKPRPSGMVNWEGRTFLVVEDEEDNYRYLEVALSLFNASLIWARDGKEAVEAMCKDNQIDIVLMDIKMPVMDGYTATKEIRKFNTRVPIIAQTAYALQGERELAFQAGCTGYIAKPVNYNDLIDIINRHIPTGAQNQETRAGL